MRTSTFAASAAPASSLRRTLVLACLLSGALTTAARADDVCTRLVDVLPTRTFADGTTTVTLTPPAASLGQWFVTASGNDPGWVKVDGKTVVTPSDLCGPRRDRVTVAVKLRASSKLEVRVPGRCDRLTVRVFGVAPSSALPAGVGKPVGDVVVFEELLPGGLPARTARRAVAAPGADGVLFLTAEQAGSAPVLLSGLLWNDEAVLGATVLRPGCQPLVEPVIAHSTNTLDAWVLGLPGSKMRVRLRGWVVDTAAPTATWANPAPDGVVAGPGTTLRLTWTDAGTGVDPSRTKITLNGHDVTSAFTLGAAEATAPFAALPAAKLVAGTNVLRATVKDRACNAVSVERRFTTGGTPPPDTTPPVITGAPANLIVEQTGPIGAVVTYTAPTATDDRDPAPVVTCVPASGTTFTAGTTTVTCTARDASGNTSTATFTVTVRDTTAPVLSQAPPNLVVEQTGPVGAVVTYVAPTVTDAADPTAQVVCLPPSGSLFPAGTTTVTCTATDAAGNASTPVTFTVVVRDTTAPVLSQVPANQTVEQTGPTGAVVAFATPTVLDAADPAPVVSCLPASGSVFPAGTTTVTCTSRDAAGNLASATFQVTVRDTIAPRFDVTPPDLTVEQTDAAGATVTYATPIATDAADASVEVLCSPPSGTTFAPGTTSVTCLARDDSGHSTSIQFLVHVADRTAPALAVVEPTSGVVAGPSGQLHLTFSDAIGLRASSLVVQVNGRDVTSLLTRSAGAANASLGALGLEQGEALLEAQMADLAGNVSAVSTTFSYEIPVVATHLVIEVPPAPGAPLRAGQSYDLTLRALTATGDVATTFTGVVTLATTDPDSLLNGLVVDVGASHGGVRKLLGLVRFAATGPHSITAATVLGPAIEGRLDLAVEAQSAEPGRVIAVVPSGAFLPGQTISARIFVDMGPSDGDPSTLDDTLGAYDVRLLYDERQLRVVRVDPGSSALGPPLFRLPGSLRLMDINDRGPLEAPLGPDTTATGLVFVASIDLQFRDTAPGGPVTFGVTGDALTTAEPAANDTLTLMPVGTAGPLPGQMEGTLLVTNGRPPAGLAVIGVLPRDGEGLVVGVQAPMGAWAFLSAPVDPSTLDTVTLSKEGAPVAGVARLGEAANVVFFGPAEPLGSGEYTLEIGAGLTELGGAPLGQPHRTTFRVGPTPAPLLADLDRDGELAVLDLQVRRDVKTGRTRGVVPEFPPVFVVGAPGTVQVSTVAGKDIDLGVVDPDGGPIGISLASLPPGASLERTGDNTFRLTLPSAATEHDIDVQAVNSAGVITTARLRVKPERTNHPPTLLLRGARGTPEPYDWSVLALPLNLAEGNEVFLEVEAIDVDLADPTGADHPHFETPSLPNVELVSYMGPHGERALYRFRPGFDQAGERELTFTVRDDAGSTATLTLSVHVLDSNRPPYFEPAETQIVGAGTLEWAAVDPDGTPVSVVLAGDSQRRLDQAVHSGDFSLSAITSTPGRLAISLSARKAGVSLSLQAMASDDQRVITEGRSIRRASPPSPEAEPEFVVHNVGTFAQGGGLFFPNTLYLYTTVEEDRPETPENEYKTHSICDFTLVNVGAPLEEDQRITGVTITGLPVDEARVLSSSGHIYFTLDNYPGIEAGAVVKGTIAIKAGDTTYEVEVRFVGNELPPPTEPSVRVLQLVELFDNGGGQIVRARVRVPEAQAAVSFFFSGAARSISSHAALPVSPGRSEVYDLDFFVGSHVSAPVHLWVAYADYQSSEVLQIVLPIGPRIVDGTAFVRYDLDGGLTLASGTAPIVPQNLRAEDQVIGPLNPYVLFAIVPSVQPTPVQRLWASLENGTPHAELPLVPGEGLEVVLANGRRVYNYAKSLPIFLTFRSLPAGSTSPIQVLDDRIIVSMSAAHGGSGRFDSNGGFEGAYDYPPAPVARPGMVEDALRVRLQTAIAGDFNEASTVIRGFVPGLAYRPKLEGYRTDNILLNGAAVWCSDSIDTWDPFMGESRLFVSDPLLSEPAALTPTYGNGLPGVYSVGQFMRQAPGFLPGPNHVRLARTPTATGPELAGTSFEANFDLTISNRAIPAKTGEGLDIDFTCDGARLGDPAQVAYPQADLVVDEDVGPGTAQVGACLLATGEVMLERVDLSIPGIAGRPETDFVLSRTYRSQIHYHGPMGHAWCSSWFESLNFVDKRKTPDQKPKPGDPGVTDPAEVWRVSGKAHIAYWTRLSNGRYHSIDGQFGILVQNLPEDEDSENGGTWTLRLPDGMKRHYDRTGLLIAIENRYGDKLRVEYDQETRQIDYVLDVYGRTIDFDFQPLDGHYYLRKVTDFSGRSIDYLYDDTTGDLVEVQSPLDPHSSPARRKEKYKYSAGFPTRYEDGDKLGELNHNLLEITSPQEAAGGGPVSRQFVYEPLTDRSAPTYDKVRREITTGTNASGVSAGGTRKIDYEDVTDPDSPASTLRVTVEEPNGRTHVHLIDKARRLELAVREQDGDRSYVTRLSYNNDGLVTLKIHPEGDIESFAYDTGERGHQRNLLIHTRLPDARRGADQSYLRTIYTYEPIFNQISSITDARGLYPELGPAGLPTGPISPSRYKTTFRYDYQESAGPIPDARDFGIDSSHVERGLGDLNEDGEVDQAAGSLVLVEAPAVRLDPASRLALDASSTLPQRAITQLIWNGHGQLIASVDPLGVVTRCLYFPMNDPDGDGAIVNGPTDPGGYIQERIVDAAPPSARRSPELPAPLGLRTRYRYDQVGNTTALIDPRGVTTQVQFNVWNQPVKVTRGAETGPLLEDPLRLVTETVYDANGRTIEVRTGKSEGETPSDERRTRYVYDLLGNLVKQTVSGAGLDHDIETTFVYDQSNNLTLTISPAEHVVETMYDGRCCVACPGSGVVARDVARAGRRMTAA